MTDEDRHPRAGRELMRVSTAGRVLTDAQLERLGDLVTELFGDNVLTHGNRDWLTIYELKPRG